MNLTFARLEALIAGLNNIADHNRVAMQGRIKHFQRGGWPGNTNTGKGRAAEYNVDAVLKLTLGFELLQLGMTPDRAANILEDNWSNVRTAINLATFSMREGRPSEAKIGDEFHVFLHFDPRGLSGIMNTAEGWEDPSDETFFYSSGPDIVRSLMKHGHFHSRRLAFIDLTELLGKISDFLGDRAEWLKAMDVWDSEQREQDRQSYKEEYGVFPEDHRLPEASPGIADRKISPEE